MSVRTIRTGGLAGVLAAGLFVIAAILDTVAPIDVVYDSSTEVLYLSASSLAFLAVVVTVTGMRALLARTGRQTRLATVGAWLVIAGYGMAALLNGVSLALGERSFVTVRLAFAVLMLIGSVILGVVVLRSRVLPWWCGILLIIAFPLGHFTNSLFASAENVLMALLWGSVGAGLLASTTASARVPAAESARVG